MLDEVKLVRIDERLIHAQIILIWLKRINLNSIIIVDDEISSNPFLSEIYKLSMPPNIDLKVFKNNDFIDYYYKEVSKKSIKRRTLIIMKNISIAISLHQSGVKFDKIQMAGTYNESMRGHNHTGKELIKKHQEEIKYFEEQQVYIYYQRVPEDPKVSLNKVLDKKGRSSLINDTRI